MDPITQIYRNEEKQRQMEQLRNRRESDETRERTCDRDQTVQWKLHNYSGDRTRERENENHISDMT